jgi:hypothetical protein
MSSERWYFRIDGKRYGPVGNAELDKLLKPPRVAPMVDARPVDFEGEWVQIGPGDDFSKAVDHFGIDFTPGEDDGVSSGKRRRGGERTWFERNVIDPLESIGNLFGKHRLTVFIAVVFLSVNAAALPYLLPKRGAERDYLATYDDIHKQFKALRKAESTTPEQWQQFSNESKKRLEPILADLAKSTDPQDQLRRYLLWAGRDCLLPIVSQTELPPAKETAKMELGYDRLKQFADTSLAAEN